MPLHDGCSPGRLGSVHARQRCAALFVELAESAPVGGNVARITDREEHAVRSHSKLLEDLQGRRLLSLDAEWVDGIDHGVTGRLGEGPHHLEGAIEVAAHRDDQGSVGKRLG